MPPPNPPNPPNPHDAFFRQVFGQPARLAGLLRSLLPPECVERLDLDALTLEPQRYLTEALTDFETDLVARVPLKTLDVATDAATDAATVPDEAYICVLVEHQSTSDRFMALRVLLYCTRIWEQLRRAFPERTTLPPIVPVVVYHGERAWSAPRTLHGLMPHLDLLPGLRAWVPDVRLLLDELTTTDDETLSQRPLDVGGRVALAALKHVRSRDFGERLRAWAAEIGAHDAGRPIELRLVMHLLQFAVLAAHHLEDETVQSIIEALPEPVQSDVGKPLAVRWMEQGEARGREEGREEGRVDGERAVLARLIERRFGPLPEAARARLDAASLWRRVLDARSLDLA